MREETRCNAKGQQQYQHHGSFSDEHPTPANIAIGGLLEAAIKPIEEPL